MYCYMYIKYMHCYMYIKYMYKCKHIQIVHVHYNTCSAARKLLILKAWEVNIIETPTGTCTLKTIEIFKYKAVP